MTVVAGNTDRSRRIEPLAADRVCGRTDARGCGSPIRIELIALRIAVPTGGELRRPPLPFLLAERPLLGAKADQLLRDLEPRPPRRLEHALLEQDRGRVLLQLRDHRALVCKHL